MSIPEQGEWLSMVIMMSSYSQYHPIAVVPLLRDMFRGILPVTDSKELPAAKVPLVQIGYSLQELGLHPAEVRCLTLLAGSPSSVSLLYAS